jgi:NAD(P)-dependent dehydrogenase (short-subunit alcohol dehydrogenase family)
MDLELRGKRAVVTGGSRGIGRAIATALVKEGARVVIAARDPETIKSAVAEIKAQTGGEIHGVPVDTREDASVDAMIAAAATTLGGIDILVNNAAAPNAAQGVNRSDDVTSAYVMDEINVKVTGYLRCARAAAPFMKRDGWGRIINVAGLSARHTGLIVGSIRNVGIAAMSKCLADELGPLGINVTTVHPGLTRTERMDTHLRARAMSDGASVEEAKAKFTKGSSIGRVIEMDEVAWVVTFLASPKSVAINGDSIGVGGGTPYAIHY